MDIRVRLAESASDLERLAPVLLELRSHFAPSTLIAQIKEQQKQGYVIALAESGGEIVGVAGFVVGSKLAWGKHIYVDDLVTRERSRSTGVGGAIIAWLRAYARDQGCGQIHLDSGVQHFSAHRFYLRHGFDITSHHFFDESNRGSAAWRRLTPRWSGRAKLSPYLHAQGWRHFGTPLIWNVIRGAPYRRSKSRNTHCQT